MRRPDPLWVRAPFVLFRFPALFGALALGAMLLCLAAIALPLFVSATTSELLAQRIDDPSVTVTGAGVMFRSPRMPLDATTENATSGGLSSGGGGGGQGGEPLFDAMSTAFADGVAASPALGPPVASVLGPVVNLTPEGNDDPLAFRSVRIFAGTGAAANVQIEAGDAGDGVLLPDLVGDALDLAPGDAITLHGPGATEVTLTVGGVYRSLYALPDSSYWQQWHDDIYQILCQDCAPLPQFLIMSRSEALRISRALHAHVATFSWQAPLATSGITMSDATRTAAFIADLRRRLTHDPIVGPGFGCCLVIRQFLPPTEAAYATFLPEVIRDVNARVESIEQPGHVLQAAGLLVAALVVAAGGMFAWGARRSEHELMLARGMSPIGVGARAALEALPPSAVGAALGVGLAALLVAGPGPDGPVAGDVWPGALAAAGIALAGALLLLTLITVAAYLRAGGRRHGSTLLRWVPWEAPLLIGGVVALQRLRETGALEAAAPGGVERPSLLLLAAPILLLAGFAILGARLFRGASILLRRASGGTGPARYLAVHRLAGAPLLTAALFAASGMCLGVFVQASTLVRSLETTVEAKAEIYVGSDAQARIDDSMVTPAALEGGVPFTRVTRLATAGTFEGSTEQFDLLAVDPSTFASAAYWRGSLAGEPLDTMVQRLRGPAPDGTVRALLVNSGETPAGINMELHDLGLDIVGRAESFPGMVSKRAMLVVDRSSLEAAFAPVPPLAEARASTEIWARGPDAAASLATMDPPPFLVLTSNEVQDIPSIAAVINTFLALNAVGLAAAVLVIGGLLMYLQSRQRAQLVAYGLSLRMGMTDRTQRASLVIELLSMLLAAFAIGAAVAVAVGLLTVPLLDPLTAIPPGPLFVLPTATIVVTAAALAIVSWLGAWITNLRARRTPMGEVMRVA